MLAYQDRRGAVEVAFTDRHGPDGSEPDDGLDLKAHDPDGLPAVPGRLADVARAMQRTTTPVVAGDPPPVVVMRQVHGTRVEIVGDPPPPRPPEADALVTASTGTILAVRAADCVPVLIADPSRGLVAAVHAGRAGVLEGAVPAAVTVLRRLGAADLVAWVGPHACGRCYEVPESLREEVAAAVPPTWSVTRWGTPALDLGAGVDAQLRAQGAEVVHVGRCTIEEAAFYSYRREGARAGRHAGLVWVRP